MALNLHLDKEDAIPDLEQAVGDVAMETNSCVMTSCGGPLETPDKSEGSSACPVEGINESVLSLLVKLKSVMTSSTTSSPGRWVKDVLTSQLGLSFTHEHLHRPLQLLL